MQVMAFCALIAKFTRDDQGYVHFGKALHNKIYRTSGEQMRMITDECCVSKQIMQIACVTLSDLISLSWVYYFFVDDSVNR